MGPPTARPTEPPRRCSRQRPSPPQSRAGRASTPSTRALDSAYAHLRMTLRIGNDLSDTVPDAALAPPARQASTAPSVSGAPLPIMSLTVASHSDAVLLASEG